jgi:hypothetical protein
MPLIDYELIDAHSSHAQFSQLYRGFCSNLTYGKLQVDIGLIFQMPTF